MTTQPSILQELTQEEEALCLQAYRESRLMQTTLPASIVAQMLFTNRPRPRLRQESPPLMAIQYVREHYRNDDRQAHALLLTFVMSSPEWPRLRNGPIPEFSFAAESEGDEAPADRE